MGERNPFDIGSGKYTVYFKVPYKEKTKKFIGVCENFNPGGLSAFWNEEKEQMLLVKYQDIVGLYPLENSN